MFLEEIVYIVFVILVSSIEVYFFWRLGLFKEFGFDGEVPEWLLILLTFLTLVSMQLMSIIFFILFITLWLIGIASRLIVRRVLTGRLNIQESTLAAPIGRSVYCRSNKDPFANNTMSKNIWKGANDDITISIDFSKDEECY